MSNPRPPAFPCEGSYATSLPLSPKPSYNHHYGEAPTHITVPGPFSHSSARKHTNSSIHLLPISLLGKQSKDTYIIQIATHSSNTEPGIHYQPDCSRRCRYSLCCHRARGSYIAKNNLKTTRCLDLSPAGLSRLDPFPLDHKEITR